MTSAKLTAVALLITFGSFGPLDKCKKKGDVADADVTDGAAASSASAAASDTPPPETPPDTPAEEETVVVDAGAGKPPITTHVPAKPRDAGAKDAGGSADAGAGKDGGATPAPDAGVGKDAGAAKGSLPPKVTVSGAAPHYDEAAIVAKIHTADLALTTCYTVTGKDPGSFDKHSYDLSFDAKGKVTTVDAKQNDGPSACVKIPLLTLSFGEPKTKTPGKVTVHMTTK